MDSVPSTSKADDEKQLQVKLKTTQESFAVPDSTLSVPENVNPEKLNQLLKSLLLDKVETVPEFDFFLSDDLLRSTLGEFIKGNLNSLLKSLLIKQKSFTIFFADREDITNEHVLEILYLEQKGAPEPQDSVNHDDWVSGVDVQGGLILSCSYDNTVCLWDAKTAEKKLQIPGHGGPVRAAAFIKVDENKNATFVSCSHDQTVVLYKYCNETNSIEGTNIGKGT